MMVSDRPVPDGGLLAWLIVFASFMVSFLQDGFRDSFGLLLGPISRHYGTGRAEAALTSAIMTFMTLGSGPLAAALLRKLGHRGVTLLGTGLASAGLLAAGLAVQLNVHSIWVLYVMVS